MDNTPIATISHWSEEEQTFAHVVVDIIEHKHKKYQQEEEKGRDPVPLKDITICPKDFENYPQYMQEIAPGQPELTTVRKMLVSLVDRGEIRVHIERRYRFNEGGLLYEHLLEKLSMASRDAPLELKIAEKLILELFAGKPPTKREQIRKKVDEVHLERGGQKSTKKKHPVHRVLRKLKKDGRASNSDPRHGYWSIFSEDSSEPTERFAEDEDRINRRTEHNEIPKKKKSANTRAEIKKILVEQFGLKCWGCNYTPPDERHLHLDHIIPKSDGGWNEIDNYALLCQPCNNKKSNTMTLSGLRKQNEKEGYTADNEPVNLKEALRWTREYRAELVRSSSHQ